MLTKSEFDDIVLTREEWKELKSFRSQASRPICIFPALIGFGLVEAETAIVYPNVLSSSYSITAKGTRYLMYRKFRPLKKLSGYLVANWIGIVTLILTAIMFFKSCSAP